MNLKRGTIFIFNHFFFSFRSCKKNVNLIFQFLKTFKKCLKACIFFNICCKCSVLLTLATSAEMTKWIIVSWGVCCRIHKPSRLRAHNGHVVPRIHHIFSLLLTHSDSDNTCFHVPRNVIGGGVCSFTLGLFLWSIGIGSHKIRDNLGSLHIVLYIFL